MPQNAVDITIGVNAETDEASFRQAEARTRELAEEANKAASTAPASPAEGPNRAAATEANILAMQRERQEMEALRAQMVLEAKGRAGLIDELEKLGRARARAAKADDVEAYRKLAAQMDETRKAYEKLNQGLEISRLGMMGQLQVSMGAMSAMQSLANEAQNGSVSLMGLASATYAVGAAIKAGMGPIGWMLLAVEALASAWDWYAKQQDEAAAAEKERATEELAALQDHLNAVIKYAETERGAALTQWSAGLESIKVQWEGIHKQEEEAAQRAASAAAGAEERRRIAAQAAYDQEAARVELAKVLGEISGQDAQRRLRAAEDARVAELRAVEDAEARRTSAAHIAAKERANREAKALEDELARTYGQFDSVLKLRLPSNEEWEALQAKFAAGLAGAEDMATRQHVRDNVAELRSLLEQMGIAWQGSDTELVKWVHSIRQAREEGEKRVAELRATARAESQASAEIVQQQQTRKAQYEAEDQQRAAINQLENARLASRRLALEWQEVQRKSLEEQAAWLEQMTASFAEGSEEARKWGETLRGVKMRAVTEELNNLNESFRVAGNYAARDSRLQIDIYKEDGKALQARHAALLRLRATPDLDAATLKAINGKIRETEEQVRGLHQAMAESAAAAQRAVGALQPLGQKARAKFMQGTLKRAEKAFVRMAQHAERQASRGDTGGMERTMKAMRRNALQQERLTGYTGQAAARMKQVEGHLRSVASGTQAQDRGLTAAQRQQNRVLASLGEERRHKARQSKAAAKAAEAQEKVAGGLEKEARAMAAAPQSAGKKLNNEVSSMRESMKRMEAEASNIKQEMAGLVAAVAACADTSAQTATLAAAAAKATEKAHDKATRANINMQKQIDRMMRKI